VAYRGELTKSGMASRTVASFIGPSSGDFFLQLALQRLAPRLKSGNAT
jgi:hypothetical protein